MTAMWITVSAFGILAVLFLLLIFLPAWLEMVDKSKKY